MAEPFSGDAFPARTCPRCGSSREEALRTLLYRGHTLRNVPVLRCPVCGYAEVPTPLHPFLRRFLEVLDGEEAPREVVLVYPEDVDEAEKFFYLWEAAHLVGDGHWEEEIVRRPLRRRSAR
ncbi:MAG: hypothetical protein KM296_09705 [Brockia lithotrophica]|nr:hypothetical protein [Brockia lithotrophica]